MKFELAELLKGALDADDVNHDSKKILDDINPEIANTKTECFDYSINCILFHLNFWQDAYIDMLNDKEISYDELPSVLSWPKEEKRRKLDFQQLLGRFYKGLEEMRDLVDKVDYHKSVSSWGGAPKLKLIIIVFQHNTYHLSQIYTIKKNLMK